jgi:RNA polymerase sigma-70 factor (ECF subfamily)
MSAYQSGAIEAFDALYARLGPAVLRYLSSRTRNSAHAQDLLQETFLQVHRSRRAYRAELPVRPWVFAIARHVLLMDWRRGACHPERSGEIPDVPILPDAASLGTRQAVRRAVALLIPARREAVLLHHIWGFSFAEIGRLLGVRADAAKLRSSRGMADLRRHLASPVSGHRVTP